MRKCGCGVGEGAGDEVTPPPDPKSAASKDMSDDERGQIVAAIARDSADLVRRQTDARGFAYEISTNVTMARG